jgi:hypothetical protein
MRPRNGARECRRDDDQSLNRGGVSGAVRLSSMRAGRASAVVTNCVFAIASSSAAVGRAAITQPRAIRRRNLLEFRKASPNRQFAFRYLGK